MSFETHDVIIGQRILHSELGEGVVLATSQNGYVTIFFRSVGQRQVPLASVQIASSPEIELIQSIQPATPKALLRLWLSIEAKQLPLVANTVTLTAAKIDLLPHQIVLTHRIAQSSPRRFLIADEVGLGKTVETALVLRELASREQLKRALLIVPAGLVENWSHEINETFHLDFEIFGSTGDVIDRKSNSFAKHDRLIASLDTLKRPARLARLLDAPPYDLIVFDEAHHLTATRSGRKVSKTENYKLAEALRDHTRDLLLLSATPHQGDHFRFWMLIRLLDPGLFTNEEDMLANRHRLNTVVMRRTKHDVCTRDGSPLFARRQVHTHCFTLAPEEHIFYEALCLYLADGYNLAKSQENTNQALGFVMAIFQKLAASSFLAVRMTLEKRLFMLTMLESILCEQSFDVDGRDKALLEARQMICQMHGLSENTYDQVQVDRLLADAKLQVLRRLKRDQEKANSTGSGDEVGAENEEDLASMLITFALPEERRRILNLLSLLPLQEESKARELVKGLRTIFHVNPREKIVIFTTYLGSVKVLQQAIAKAFPNVGIEVLKGGDHGAKLAAERRFRRSPGAQILICTAAGREGINLQFAHILFNADLPWNPMELEQRIGRIHRYGQQYTSQVYNLVAADTIEGQIFLLLEQKVNDIAATLGKVDENGDLAEDLRSQILGQLSEQLSYERLYQEALQDPTLLRTRLELEVAMQNVETARHAVLELFQDLEGFRLDDYTEVDDAGQSLERLRQFIALAASAQGGELRQLAEELFLFSLPDQPSILLATNRDSAVADEEIELIGLEQAQVAKLLRYWANLPLQERALAAQAAKLSGVLTIWHISIQGDRGVHYERVIWLGVSIQGERSPQIESVASNLRKLQPSASTLDVEVKIRLLQDVIPQILQRELIYSGALTTSASYSSKLIGWIELLA